VKMSTVYLVLAVLGVVIPHSQFLPWAFAHGVDVPLMMHELFINHISTYFTLDLLVAGAAALVFMIQKGIEVPVPHIWVPIAVTLIVGLSCGLPLFLFLLERRADANLNRKTILPEGAL